MTPDKNAPRNFQQGVPVFEDAARADGVDCPRCRGHEGQKVAQGIEREDAYVVEGNEADACHGYQEAPEEIPLQLVPEDNSGSQSCEEGRRADDDSHVGGVSVGQRGIFKEKIHGDTAESRAGKSGFHAPSSPVAEEVGAQEVQEGNGYGESIDDDF